MCRIPLTDVTKKDKYNASINLVEMCYAWCLAKMEMKYKWMHTMFLCEWKRG
jgi:hypothetical protein